jgi:hypothetical protein
VRLALVSLPADAQTIDVGAGDVGAFDVGAGDVGAGDVGAGDVGGPGMCCRLPNPTPDPDFFPLNASSPRMAPSSHRFHRGL